MTAKHPARFTQSVLDSIAELCADLLADGAHVLDPFAGTGRVHALPYRTTGVELEPEWASMAKGTIVGNALALPFPNATFDAVVTSPCYGNRFADHHRARDASLRRSYTHDIGRELHTDNAGAIQWGERYRVLHRRAWEEVDRVLKRKGIIVLNISDHVRGRKRQRVAGFHLEALQELGFTVIDVVPVLTPRTRYGENAEARVDAELVTVLQ
jgi:tRNA G10  N-methylase Trm11